MSAWSGAGAGAGVFAYAVAVVVGEAVFDVAGEAGQGQRIDLVGAVQEVLCHWP